MINTEIYHGHIVQFDIVRNVGYIETVANDAYFFFLDKTAVKRQSRAGLIKHAHQFCAGDEVFFKLRQSNRDVTKKEAWDLKFIKNERMYFLITDAASNIVLEGVLKQNNDDKFFVQHNETCIYLELEISKWEEDIALNYVDRIDTQVAFKLLKPKINGQLSAVLVDRKFKEEYLHLAKLLEAQTPIPAIIKDKNPHGFFVTILNNTTNAFIDCSKEKLMLYDFKNGEVINVVVKGQHENGVRVAIA